jgi:stress response protein YsnF
MTQTITALFESRADAESAVNELIDAGIPASSIRTTPERDSGRSTGATSYDPVADEGGFWASLKDLFMPEDDRHAYAEALHRGKIMVAATVDDGAATRAANILEERGTVNLDEHEASWRKEGWSAPSVSNMTPQRQLDQAGDQKLQTVEERLQVGKRQVDSGRVKIRSYVVETPVSESVNLRTESVHVDRVAVDRLVRPGEDPFKERTIEATATSEAAVVAKEARVTGEVLLRKTADERVETLHDTVRSTKIDVDETAGKPVTTPGAKR